PDLSLYSGVVSMPLFPAELLAILEGTRLPDYSLDNEHQKRLQQFSGNALIAEDNKTNQVVAKGLLTQFGLEVVIAGDGYEALHKMREERFDIIFMDCQMPVMDGFRTTRELRQTDGFKTSSQVPVIALTANAMQDDRKRCIEAGMDEFLTKPIDPEQLEKALNRFLPQAQQEESLPAANTVEERATEPATGAEAKQIPIFDFEEYSHRLSHELELMQLVMEAAIDDIRQILAELETTPNDKLTATLHQLKGLVANCSAKALLDKVIRMEAQGKAGDYNQIRQQLPDLISLSQSFEREMKARLFSQEL
ncbi:response regulator, partial [Oceanospirillum sp. HFRX-1_2]